MEAEITFAWRKERNPADYEVIAASDPRVLPGQSILDVPVSTSQPGRVRAKGVCLDRYEPQPDLWERFARIESHEQAIDFVRTSGPLTRAGLPDGKGDIIADIEDEAAAMRRAVTGPPVKLYARLGDGRLTVSPGNLLDALWLQYADAKSRNRANRCKQCNHLFQTGPAGRRKGAFFCSEKCKVDFHSLARSRR